MSCTDLDYALLRGDYMTALARVEHAGIPIDMPSFNTLTASWTDITDYLIRDIDRSYGVFEGRTFKRDRFEQFLIRNGLPWPRLPDSGELALDDDTFSEQEKLHPSLIAPLHQLRQSLGQLRLNKLAIGQDGRNRCMLSAFAAKTGRNQPSNSKFIFGLPAWLRSLIRAPEGHAVAYIDWAQQEFGIAAAFSNCPAMIRAYQSGDPYMTFAIQAGAAPEGATKKTHEDVREQYKTCALGVLYAMGKATLSQRTGLPIPYAEDLLRRHRQTYPEFWDWSDRVLNHGMIFSRLNTVFDWRIQLVGEPNPNSIRNFPMQANGAEMLRLAVIFAIERGVKVIAPVHDALMIEAPEGELVSAVIETRRAMARASRIVLQTMELRTDVKVCRYPIRYMDKRGVQMWRKVWQIIREQERS